MPSPTLSPIERARITEAAKLAANGTPVKWLGFGMRLVFTVGNREHLVTSAGTRRVFDALCEQAREFYREAHAQAVEANQANGAQAREASEQAAKGEKGPIAESAVHGLAEDPRTLCGLFGDGCGATGGSL